MKIKELNHLSNFTELKIGSVWGGIGQVRFYGDSKEYISLITCHSHKLQGLC